VRVFYDQAVMAVSPFVRFFDKFLNNSFEEYFEAQIRAAQAQNEGQDLEKSVVTNESQQSLPSVPSNFRQFKVQNLHKLMLAFSRNKFERLREPNQLIK
jgi:hypothetical protein